MCVNDTENWNFYTDSVVPLVLKKKAKIDGDNGYQRKTLKQALHSWETTTADSPMRCSKITLILGVTTTVLHHVMSS